MLFNDECGNCSVEDLQKKNSGKIFHKFVIITRYFLPKERAPKLPNDVLKSIQERFPATPSVVAIPLVSFMTMNQHTVHIDAHIIQMLDMSPAASLVSQDTLRQTVCQHVFCESWSLPLS